MLQNPNANSCSTQRDRILRLLSEAHGSWVLAPQLAKVGGLQFQTRIHELRHKVGLHVENRVEHRDGQKLSFYRLVTGPRVPADSSSTVPRSRETLEHASEEGEPSREAAPLLLFDITATHKDLG